MTLYLRYQAVTWVEVDTDDEDVANVVVDELTMTKPVDVLDGDGAVARSGERGPDAANCGLLLLAELRYGSQPM